MNYDDYLLKVIDLITKNKYPRGFGNPYRANQHGQHYILDSKETVLKFIKLSDYKNCFMTNYAFETYTQKERDPDSAIIDTILFDLDDEENPENAFEEMKKLIDWSSRHDIVPIISYSGSKGMHLRFQIPPIKLNYPRESVRKFVNELADTGNFETIDRVVTYDLNRIIRIPGTIHPKTNRYCTLLNPKLIKFMKFTNIVHMSKSKPTFIPEPTESGPEFGEYLEWIDFNITAEKKKASYKMPVSTNGKFQLGYVYDTECPAAENLITNGSQKGSRDYALCGLVHYYKREKLTYAEIKDKMLAFAKVCKPEIADREVLRVLGYHYTHEYSPCTFFSKICSECDNCSKIN